MTRDFPSKRDAWLVGVVWIGTAMAIGGALVVLLVPGAHAAVRWLVAAACVASAVFGPWILYDTGYRVGAEAIAVRSGPFRWTVPLAAILSVEPTGNPLSSPATSLDRLSVLYRTAKGRERSILLSPADKSGFLDALDARCAHLARAGDRLTAIG